MKKTTLLLSMLALMLALLAISASAAETVIYENDFSDAATLSDFKQYRAEWEIKDGGLYLTDRLDADAPNNSPRHNFCAHSISIQAKTDGLYRRSRLYERSDVGRHYLPRRSGRRIRCQQ